MYYPVFEYLPDIDKLREHLTVDIGVTICGKETGVRLPNGEWDEDQDVWYSDHERDIEDIVICHPCERKF